MKTKVKLTVAGITALAFGFAIYLGFVHKFADGVLGFRKLFPDKGKPDDSEKEEQKGDLPEGKGDTPQPTSDFPIAKGTKSANVKAIQDSLRGKFNSLAIVSDGDYGLKTETALNKIGYYSPISKSDFSNILAGKKKDVAKPEMPQAQADSLAMSVKVPKPNVRITKGGMDIIKNKYLAVMEQLKRAGYKMVRVDSKLSNTYDYYKAQKI